VSSKIEEKIKEISDNYYEKLDCKLTLTSSIPEGVNHYIKPRAFMMKVNGKLRPQISMYTTADAKKFKEQFVKYVKDEVKKQGWFLVPNDYQHFYIDANFVFPRIDMDANNYWKEILDGITSSGKIWEDDNVTCERVNSITYNGSNPHIKMVITPVEYIGIFKDLNDLNLFMENECNKCSKLKNNCSILNKAVEGRIQEEVSVSNQNIITCSKFKEIKSKK